MRESVRACVRECVRVCVSVCVRVRECARARVCMYVFSNYDKDVFILL